MDSERNKATIRRLNDEVINQGRVEVLEELYASDLVHVRRGLNSLAKAARERDPRPDAGADLPARERFKRGLKAIHGAFADWHSQIEEQVGEGDLVITRYTVTGTHTGELFGIPPTGQTIAMDEVVFFRFNADGKVKEIWAIGDELGLLLQLGAVRLPVSSAR